MVIGPNVAESLFLNQPNIIGSIVDLGGRPFEIIGVLEKRKNSFGVFDMVGNVHEWVADPNGTFRGGYYLDTTLNGEGCNYRTDAHDATYHDYSTGFRCCADLPSSGGKK